MRELLKLACAVLILLFVRSVPLPALPRIQVYEGAENLVASRIEGRWRVSRTLTERLFGGPFPQGEDIVFRLDASVTEKVPDDFFQFFSGKSVHGAGTLQTGTLQLLFFVVEEQGSPRILCFRPGNTDPAKIRSLYLALVPARDIRDDLLFLGGTSLDDPFVAHERMPTDLEARLSRETLDLLSRARNRPSPELAALGNRPDWQTVLDLLTEEVRQAPRGENNNRGLIAEALLAAHLEQARFDVSPFIQMLHSEVPTNQQKAAQVVAVAAQRKDLVAGVAKEAVRALIPLTASQRGRVVDGAVNALHRLTGETALRRDPEGWARWFEKTYGEPVEVSGSVYELLAVIKISGGQDNPKRYSLNGSEPLIGDELEGKLRSFAEEARRLDLQPAIVAVFPEDLTSTTIVAAGVSPELKEIEGAAEKAGIGWASVTLAPPSDVFYPPYLEGVASLSVKKERP